ncbi:MAG: M20 family metallopeptidase [Thermoproteota archaeon]
MNAPLLVEKHVGWAVDVLKRLVSVPTVNPPGRDYKRFAEVSSEVLKQLGMEVEVVEVPQDIVSKHEPEGSGYPRFIIVGRLGSGRPVVHFNGHYDVVPPGSGWTRDPFNPVVEDGRIYGRGAVDMKGGIAAALLAVRAFAEAHPGFKGTIEIALVPDEETGGETGTGYLLSSGLSKPDYALIPEPSGSRNVWIGHRGAFWFFVEVKGKQAHGSTPWLGVNAFEYMVKVANDFIEAYRKVLEGKQSRYEYDDPRGAKPTATFGGEVRGGAKVNVVPGYYAFSVDRRLIVEETVEEVEKEVFSMIEELKAKYSEVEIGVKVTNRMPPAFTSPDSTLARELAASIEDVTGSRPRLTVCLGGLDLRFYSERGIQTVSYGPGPIHMAHQADEYVEVEELEKVAKAYARLMERLLTSSS